jgi:peptidoglycan hydrolase-like protein with peptidoglycan-binding domain
MLAANGFYGGPADGKAGRGTVRAITEWQKRLGVDPTGVIEVGDIIFVTSLPARLALDEAVVKPGGTLSGGEPVLQGLSTAPRFEVPVTSAQAAMMPEGTKVTITSPSGDAWVALAGTQQSDVETGSLSVALTGEADGSICGEGCGQIPVVGEALLSSTIVTVPSTAGLVIPTAALVSGADGTLAVITADGERLPVTVVAAARGMSVVEGVDEGTRVRVPGEGSTDAAS